MPTSERSPLEPEDPPDVRHPGGATGPEGDQPLVVGQTHDSQASAGIGVPLGLVPLLGGVRPAARRAAVGTLVGTDGPAALAPRLNAPAGMASSTGGSHRRCAKACPTRTRGVRRPYEASILPTGGFAGSPQDALDCACALYLSGPDS